MGEKNNFKNKNKNKIKLIWSSLNFSLKHFEFKKKISNEFSFNGYVTIYSCTKIPVQCTKNLVQACTLNINLLINQNIVSKIFDYQKIHAPKIYGYRAQALVSFKKYMPPPLPYFKVNIYPFPLPHFASIFFAYL